MSFILDALKKSETDRQQTGSADFAGVPMRPQSPPVTRWLWIVGFLLAINLAVLIGLLLRPDTAPPQTLLPLSTSDASLPPAIKSADPSFEERVAAARQNVPEPQAEPSAEQPIAVSTGLVKPVVISQDPSAIPASDLYPSFQEVSASGSIDLPQLHLDIHVFSTEPEDRFVFINMSKLHEGSHLSEGPVVAEIVPEGVVLRHQGQLFLLSRDQ